jgi:hypothetical protein
MRKGFGSTLALLLAIVSIGSTMAQTQTLEQNIWTLLDDSKATYVSLGEAEFRALGAGFDLPDGGKAITRLAEQAPGGAFDPRDVAKLAPQQLGYKASWVVERFRRYNLDWDITGLRLESLDPDATRYPWFIVMNGGAANFYEFFVDLRNRPGWTQYLAQKLNVMIVTIPGNFKYGGWEQPVADAKRQPAYLLDRELAMDEYEVRNAIFTNSLIMQGLKALVTKHTSGDMLLIGHSTSGELAMLAYEDPELNARLKGRFLGWGSGGPARLELLRTVRGKEVADRAGASPPGGKIQLHVLEVFKARGLPSSLYTDRGSHYFFTPKAGDHYVKTQVKVHQYPDGTLAVFHGPRCLARYSAQGEQIVSAPTTKSVTPCSPPSRTLRAASLGQGKSGHGVIAG